MNMFRKPLMIAGNISWRHALIVFIVALSLRLVFLGYGDMFSHESGDSPGYITLAESLKSGTGLSLDGHSPTAIRLPGYPAFIAAVTSIPGAGMQTVRFFQALVDSLTCVLLYFLALRLLDPNHALLSGLILAFYVPGAARSMFILSETLFSFFLVASVFLLVKDRSSRLVNTCFSGLTIGVACLVRPNGIIILAFLLLWIGIFRPFPLYIRHAVVFVSCALVIISPWIVRNYLVFHHFIPTSTLNGYALYNSYLIPEKGLGFNEIKPEHAEYFTIESEPERNSYLLGVTVRHIARHPVDALSLTPVKLSLLAYPYNMKWLISSSPVRLNVFWLFVFLSAVTGLVFRRRYTVDRLQAAMAVLVALLVTSVVFYGSARMRAPFDPFIIMISSTGAMWFWQHKKRIHFVAAFVVFTVVIAVCGEMQSISDLLKSLKPW